MIKWFEKLGLMTTNYRGELIPEGAGIFFVIGTIIAWSTMRFLHLGEMLIIDHLLFLTAIIGGAGFIDDFLGSKDYQGFRGHFHQLFKGKITTGAFKAIIAFLAVLLVLGTEEQFGQILIDMGLILLMTNFLNLVDLRPGRAVKVFLFLSFLLLFLLPNFWFYFLPIYFILIIYIPFDLKGRVMLGDTGANTLGIILGYGFSNLPFFPLKLIFLLALFILTILAEKFSFTKFIEKNSLLGWMDRLGR